MLGLSSSEHESPVSQKPLYCRQTGVSSYFICLYGKQSLYKGVGVAETGFHTVALAILELAL